VTPYRSKGYCSVQGVLLSRESVDEVLGGRYGDTLGRQVRVGASIHVEMGAPRAQYIRTGSLLIHAPVCIEVITP
jgi:hypothetical protein